jgi:NTP pyrophosphatase (non-canonical NTP hydrolase)
MPHDISFQQTIELYRAVYQRFSKIEGRPWGAEGATIELVKQVGEMAKYVMVMERYYFPQRQTNAERYEADKEKLGDELADILAQLIRLADHYQIDLVDAYLKAQQEAAESLQHMDV